MHSIIHPGEHGLSAFARSFKRNAMRDIRNFLFASDGHTNGDYESSRPRLGEYLSPKKMDASPGDCESPLRVINGISVNRGAIHWQKGFYVREMHSERQWGNSIAYVQWNAVRHGIVKNIDDWPWTSLHFPELIDQRGVL